MLAVRAISARYKVLRTDFAILSLPRGFPHRPARSGIGTSANDRPGTHRPYRDRTHWVALDCPVRSTDAVQGFRPGQSGRQVAIADAEAVGTIRKSGLLQTEAIAGERRERIPPGTTRQPPNPRDVYRDGGFGSEDDKRLKRRENRDNGGRRRMPVEPWTESRRRRPWRRPQPPLGSSQCRYSP